MLIQTIAYKETQMRKDSSLSTKRKYGFADHSSHIVDSISVKYIS
ncbi:hypothetical protein EC843_101208 [Buttiauxella sp. JUb87]|jgi:hypothetical protein|nr:hypothetical protein EC843_101208 [Buttiauxella sp. JUb87]